MHCIYLALQLITAIQGVDKIIGQLMDGLKMLKMTQCINIIIVADHGKKCCGLKLLNQSKQ